MKQELMETKKKNIKKQELTELSFKEGEQNISVNISGIFLKYVLWALQAIPSAQLGL